MGSSASVKGVGRYFPIERGFSARVDAATSESVSSLFTTIANAYMNTQDSDGEIDSLFGSPPPSPAPELNRGGSPALALPGRASANCVVSRELPKNVGTIALPGSHDRSELVVSLPASPPRQQVARCDQPAQPVPRQYRFAEYIGPRATSLPASTTARRKLHKGKKAKSATPELGTNAATFILPRSGDTLPPHFLRNQPGLLGSAGVVGGINPSNSSTFEDRGATKQNPIVVEEEILSIETPWKKPQPQANANAPLPSSQAIADVLISQGNIFPILRSFMPYFGLNANVVCSSLPLQQYRLHDQARSSDIAAPPLKRRKLHSVPAGAKDWDVPYPFPANEGPPHYLESWQKKRGKKLMMKLVLLVRDAVQKAASRSQLPEHSSKPAQQQQQQQETSSASPDVQQIPAMAKYGNQMDLPLTNPDPSNPSITSASSPPHEHDVLSEIFASSGVGPDSFSSFGSDFDSFLGAVNDALSDPDVQLTGNDLATMASYPFSPTLSTSPTLTSSTRLSTPCDFSQLSTAENKENDVLQLQNFNFDDVPIDPSLLDFSWPDLSPSGTQNLRDVPLPSTSLEDAMHTDASQTATLEATSAGQTVDGFSFDPGLWQALIDDPELFMSTLSSVNAHDNAQTRTLPNILDHQVEQQSPDIPPMPVEQQMPPKSMELQFRPPMVDGTVFRGWRGGSSCTSGKPDKQDVLRRARVRREQLAAELARAKIELWETTIEQGVLTHLSKDKELQTNEI